jgi:hypothetical protein
VSLRGDGKKEEISVKPIHIELLPFVGESDRVAERAASEQLRLADERWSPPPAGPMADVMVGGTSCVELVWVGGRLLRTWDNCLACWSVAHTTPTGMDTTGGDARGGGPRRLVGKKISGERAAVERVNVMVAASARHVVLCAGHTATVRDECKSCIQLLTRPISLKASGFNP